MNIRKFTPVSVLFVFGFYIFLFVLAGHVSAQVVINEFSSYTSNDWVELYSNEDVDISGWILRDSATSRVKTLPDHSLIGPSTSKYFNIDASNRLNINTDTVKLYKSDESTLVDEVTYGGNGNICAPGEGQTIGRLPDGSGVFVRFASNTELLPNNAQEAPCPAPTPTSTLTPTLAPTDTPKPTSTPKPTATPTPTKVPTPVPTKTPTPVPTKSPTPTLVSTKTPTPVSKKISVAEDSILASSDEVGQEELVLGIRNQLADSSSEDSNLDSTASGAKKSFSIVAITLVGAGVFCMAGGALAFFRRMKRDDIKDNPENKVL